MDFSLITCIVNNRDENKNSRDLFEDFGRMNQNNSFSHLLIDAVINTSHIDHSREIKKKQSQMYKKLKYNYNKNQ